MTAFQPLPLWATVNRSRLASERLGLTGAVAELFEQLYVAAEESGSVQGGYAERWLNCSASEWKAACSSQAEEDAVAAEIRHTEAVVGWIASSARALSY